MNIHYILYNTLSLKPSIFTPLISSKTVVIQPITHNILPSFAQVLAIKNTYAPLLPWQTNSIFIIFQVPPKMLSFALICPDLPSVSERLFCHWLCHQNPKRGKIRQIDAVNRSKNVVRIGGVTTVRLILVFLFCSINRNLNYNGLCKYTISTNCIPLS